MMQVAMAKKTRGAVRRTPGFLRRSARACVGLLASMLFAAAATAATPPGTNIDNQARLTYEAIPGRVSVVTSNVVRTTSVFGRTPASVSFLRLAPGGSGVDATVSPTECSQAGAFVPLATPLGLDGQPLDLNAPQAVLSTTLYNASETAYLELDDGDQNLDPNLREWVSVTLTNPTSNDSEVLRLLETAENTGVFTGFVPLQEAAATAGNCVLEGLTDSQIQIDYTDPADAQDATAASALVAPLSVVFDAATGETLDGAIITLIDDTTGQPATVFGNDGVSAYPATVVAGAQTTDASGLVYSVPTGGFRFPVVQAGRYRLQVTPPANFLAPSNRTEAELAALPGGSFNISDASFLLPFEQLLDGATTLFDIPLDPFDGGLLLSKTTTATSAAVGDYVQYRLQIQNTSERIPATGISLTDVPPAGFRYVPGSARLNGEPFGDPIGGGAGASFIFELAEIAPAASVTLTYVMEVTGGARGRRAVNAASATADGDVVSNEASIGIALREDLFRDRATLIGRVVDGDCESDTFSAEAGVAGVRVYLEDGRYAVTDEQGRYHLEGLLAGRSVVQMDPLTVPEWMGLAPCAAPRFGGRADSQWVDLIGGQVQRADFYLKRKAPGTGKVALKLVNASGAAPDTIDYTLSIDGTGDVVVDDLSVTVLLPKAATLDPQSARLNGRKMPSLRQTGSAVVFVLGARDRAWRDQLTFTAEIDPAFAGELVSKAVANFNTPAARNQRTPVGEARMQREAATTENADYVLSLTFDVLSAELSTEDRATLDALVAEWQGVYDIDLVATGHTDADRIAARNREIFADNYALSQARAASAAEYLANALKVPAANITVKGMGADAPVASNNTEAGKRRNRRVELIMSGIRPGKQSAVLVTQSASDVLKIDTVGRTPGPDAIDDPLDAKIREINERLDQGANAANEALSQVPTANGIVWPTADYQPAIPSTTIAVAHSVDSKVELLINEQPVSALNFEGSTANDAKTRMLSQWRGVDLVDGENRIEARVIRSDGSLEETFERSVHFAGHPIRGALLPDQSRLIADGRKRPVIAVQLFDGVGEPAREASVGDFSINAPYRSWYEVAQERENSLVELNQRDPFYRVGPNGIAYIELEPTTQAGEVTLRLLFPNQREQLLRTYLEPEPRDWILVGFAEGTVGYNTLRDNAELATRSGFEDDLYEEGRVAFFAKGRVKGDYLLTIAYDSRGNAEDLDRFEAPIDPDAYYTLYADGTESRFEAASQRKLYIKLERRQFSALFGDFSTGLSTNELARYERRFNGLQTTYFGKNVTVNAFATETDQRLTRDDIPGDGTSGLYRLSGQDIVPNSDVIRIETRDRFRANEVLTTRSLTRFVDYDVDYINGTLFFKQPIPSRDGDLNPLVIVAEYESRNAGDQDLIAGGRVAVKTSDDRLEVGVTGIQEENAVDANTLVGADLRWQVSPETLVTAEYADTERDDLSAQTSGYAYRVNVEHRTGAIDARVYHSYADANFGLGLQAASQVGIEQTGADMRIQFAERWFLQAQAAWQENLETELERETYQADLRYEDERNSAFFGVSSVSDNAADGQQRESELVRAGVARNLFRNRVTLRASAEQSLGDSDGVVDYPARQVLGLDLNLRTATLFAEHEWAEGQSIDAQTTRVGLQTSPWQRAQFTSSLDNQVTEFGPRLFANFGFVQGLQVSERWTLDFGVDHSNTLVEQDALIFDTDRELASGSIRDDYVAGYVGAAYQSELWSANTRAEHRNADNGTRDTLLFGWFREPIAGHGLSAGLQYTNDDRLDSGQQVRGDFRVGWAYRVADRRWSFLDRLDIIHEEQTNLGTSRDSMRYVNNFNATRRIGPAGELTLQYAAKYVSTEFDGNRFSGYTDLAGASYRRSFRPRWDYQLQAGVLHNWDSGTRDYTAGAAIGFNPRDNVWLTLGYNFAGFRDEDFAAARYTASGPFLRVAIKADQETLKAIAGRIRNRR
ncbi:MAG: OmpA family protein [Pseudomonadota bacterium]